MGFVDDTLRDIMNTRTDVVLMRIVAFGLVGVWWVHRRRLHQAYDEKRRGRSD
jgi:uncharacterized membrane-anchored protein